MNLGTVDVFPSHVILSTRLVSELGDAHSTLRAAAQRNGAAVVIYAGGEIDACNEGAWRRLLSEAAVAVAPPGPLVVDTNDLDFMGCCAFAVLADEADRCRRRGVHLCLVSRQPVIPRIIAACGLSGVVPVYPTAEAALAAVTVPPTSW